MQDQLCLCLLQQIWIQSMYFIRKWLKLPHWVFKNEFTSDTLSEIKLKQDSHHKKLFGFLETDKSGTNIFGEQKVAIECYNIASICGFIACHVLPQYPITSKLLHQTVIWLYQLRGCYFLFNTQYSHNKIVSLWNITTIAMVIWLTIGYKNQREVTMLIWSFDMIMIDDIRYSSLKLLKFNRLWNIDKFRYCKKQNFSEKIWGVTDKIFQYFVQIFLRIYWHKVQFEQKTMLHHVFSAKIDTEFKILFYFANFLVMLYFQKLFKVLWLFLQTRSRILTKFVFGYKKFTGDHNLEYLQVIYGIICFLFAFQYFFIEYFWQDGWGKYDTLVYFYHHLIYDINNNK